MRRFVVGIVALVAAVNVALAQPFTTTELPETRVGSGSARMPINVMPDPEPDQDAVEVVPPQALPPVISLEQPIDPDHYVCGAGDVLELNFWGQQNLRLKLTIDLEGRVFIPKVGYVAVADKTLTAMRPAIKQKVRGNYPGLSFDLTVLTPRTFLVHVVENVKHAGTFSAHAIDRVSSVLARAGVVPAASRRRITVHHRSGPDSTADLVKYELTGDTAFNPYLLDGDIVHVPFPLTMVKVSGAVRRPRMSASC